MPAKPESMTIPSHIIRLYNTAARRYRKLKRKLGGDGTARKLSTYDRASIALQLQKLRKRLAELHFQVKILASIGAVALTMNANTSFAQTTTGPFVEKQRADNPLRWPFMFTGSRPALVDWDADGDLDLVVGEDGNLLYFKNVGNSTDPRYIEEVDNNPFDGLRLTYQEDAVPTFADFDGDGDLDLFVGTNYNGENSILYYKNEGGFGAPEDPNTEWDNETKTGNPFLELYEGYGIQSNTQLALADMDGDGDLDAFIASHYEAQGLHYFRNDLDGEAGSFVREDIIPSWSEVGQSPQLVDLDGDGDLDMFSGSAGGYIAYYINTPVDQDPEDDNNPLTPQFTEQETTWNPETMEGNPLYDFGFGSNLVPRFADLDGDGDLDLVVGRVAGDFRGAPLVYLENITERDPVSNEVVSFHFVEKVELQNPFDGILASGIYYLSYINSNPGFIDIDNDGDLDLILGEKYPQSSKIKVYRNVDGEFDRQPYVDPETGDSNFFDFEFNTRTSPEIVDINGDGFQDVFITHNPADSELPAIILYINNQDGTFRLASASENPFSDVTDTNVRLMFIDVDNDGDPDALRTTDGNMTFYRNTGTTTNPIMTPESPHPFESLPSDYSSTYEAVDIDRDGFSDIIFSDLNLPLQLFHNNGDETFFEIVDEGDPFITDPGGDMPRPSFSDHDQDGDLDMFVGVRGGRVKFLRNENPAPQLLTEITEIPFAPGDPPRLINDELDINDPDNDPIQEVVITILGYEQGVDELLLNESYFEAFSDVTFDNENGIITITGPAPSSDFVDALRTLTYRYVPEETERNGRDNSNARSISKTIRIEVFDTDKTNPAPVDFVMAYPNKFPTLSSSAPDVTYTTPGVQQVIDNTITVSDDDDPDISSATVSIASGYVSAQDQLMFTNQNGITGVFNSSSGVLALTGVSSKANYQAALRSIQYRNVAASPNTAVRTITFLVNDGENSSNVENADITFNLVPVLTRSKPVSTFSFSPVEIDNAITLNEDGATIASATVSITSGLQAAQDVLLFTNQNGISGTFDASAGILTLTGTAPKSDYQTALRTVRYNNTATSPNTSPRSVQFMINDGFSNSVAESLSIVFNSPPSLNLSIASVSYVNGTPLTLDNALSVADDGMLTGATIALTAGLQTSQDELQFTAQSGITGSYSTSTGMLTLSGLATANAYEAALRTVRYNNTSSTPNTSPRMIQFRVQDDAGLQSAPVSLSLAFATQIPPSLSSGTTGRSYASGTMVVDNTISVSDADDTHLESATIAVSAGFVSTEDVLSFTPGGGITGSFNPAAGVLSLTGTAPVAAYQLALRSVTYANTNTGDRTKTPRTIAFRVNDGTDNSNSISCLVSLPNQAPALAGGGAVAPYVSGTVQIAGALTISDGDNATLSGASVTITQGLVPTEDELVFSSQNGIAGNYDVISGTLQLSGSASIAHYQTALRSVEYLNTNAGDRNKQQRVFRFTATDGATQGNMVTFSLDLPNQAPVVVPGANPPLYGAGKLVLAPALILSDNDNATLESASITISGGFRTQEDFLTFEVQSGISGSYSASTGRLQFSGNASESAYQAVLRSVSYENISPDPDTSPRVFTFQVNDGMEDSPAAAMSLSINGPPVITAPESVAEAGKAISLNVAEFVSDPDNNLDLNDVASIVVVSQPTSGATARVVGNSIEVDYSGVPEFSGEDRFTIMICDALGRCVTADLDITVGGELIVYNAVSPNGDNHNQFLKLVFLNRENKVIIYNRWGDRVFEMNDYDSDVEGKRFEGRTNDGNDLPNGTYYYKIFYPGGVHKSGFLSLKR